MLSNITIRDFAIIEALELDIHRGLTVITGETGAGKSIIIDALGLTLGQRADAGAVRHGATRADITADFNISQLPTAQQWLEENDLSSDGDCLLRRTISAEGRSRATINGAPVPLAQLKNLGEILVDIHGQHAHQSLLKRDAQRDIVDEFGNHQNALAELNSTYQAWRKVDQEFTALNNTSREQNDRLDLLRFHVQELNLLAPQDNEVAELEADHQRLANADRLLSGNQQLLQLLYDNDDGSAHSLLAQAERQLSELAALDDSLNDATESLAAALTNTQDAADALRSHSDRIELDPGQLQTVEDRLSSLLDAARKHRVEPDELPAHLIALQTELDTIENADDRLEQLATERDALSKTYQQQSQALSADRKIAAKTLSEKITAAMQPLGLPQGQLEIAVEHDDAAAFSANGQDRVDILVSLNPGQPLRPLNKVASGGELSRISLAIQVVAASALHIPCRVFDEVDTGIGGGVAETVGQELRQLGAAAQVLCITHLPQVAAFGHQHLHVVKRTDGEQTHTTLVPLSKEERIAEIARMLGGNTITPEAQAHAEQLFATAGN